MQLDYYAECDYNYIRNKKQEVNKMKKGLGLMLVLLLACGLLVAGCGSNSGGEQTSDNQQEANQETAQTASVGELTKENPITVNKEEGSITFLGQVNGKYFYEPTRHAAVFVDGGNGDKAVFRGFVNHEDFYNALIEIGAKAGENMTLENKEQTHVEGDAFDITVTWTGAEKEVTIDEAIKDSNGTPIDIRFGGNLTNALDKKTGCLICLDSCPVGITSNAAYTYGAVEKTKEVGFTGNKDVLPADGTYVAITMKLKK